MICGENEYYSDAGLILDRGGFKIAKVTLSRTAFICNIILLTLQIVALSYFIWVYFKFHTGSGFFVLERVILFFSETTRLVELFFFHTIFNN